MIDYALQTNIVKRSDKRLSDDNFTYKDWSLGVYSKSRNLLISPEDVIKMKVINETPLQFTLER